MTTRVRVKPVPHAVVVKDSDGWIKVQVTWTASPALDRPDGVSYGLGPNHARLAKRLAKAINDDVVFINPSVETDVNGKTYIMARTNVSGRTINADLTRMGY